MRRRDFITLLSGATAWPLTARAQQPERVRRIGVLLPAAADDLEFQTRVGAFLQGLQELRWTIGRNVRVDTRWATSNADSIRKHAAELTALAPDVILAFGASTVGPLLQETRTVPVVFPVVGDPVAAGFVASLARPGGNATGFMTFEYGMGGKWLELLKQIAPAVTRLAVLRDPAIPTGPAQFGVIQAAAPSAGMEVRPIDARDAGEIERGVTALARDPNGGLIITASAASQVHRNVIITLAARHKLPAKDWHSHTNGAVLWPVPRGRTRSVGLPAWIVEGAVEDPGELSFRAQSMKSCAARLIRVRGLLGLRELTLELALNRTDGWGFRA
jgi:putative tryptophan/tyrosine transport system substrate-binding protein